METVTEDRPGSAVDDHLEAESERSAAEAEAALEAQQADLDNDPAQVDPPEEPEPAGEPEAPEAAIGDPALSIPGSQLSFSGVGGKAPTSATVRLTGGRIDLPVGQLKKGSDVVLRVVARVKGVAFEDELDPTTKQAIGCERRHGARIIDVGLLDTEGSLRAAVEAGRAQGVPDEDLVKALEALLEE